VVPASSETLVALPADVALHARPAGQFVRMAIGFDADIVVGVGDREADAKSLLAVLALGARGGTTLHLRADGGDADAALDALAECVASFTE
jgi:phosphotransferase system HPr (HPr) family protein